MKRPIVVLATLFSMTAGPAVAADIYRCAGIYTDTPCGMRNRVILNMNANAPSEDSRVAAITRYYESRLYLLAREYADREFQMTKAYLSGTRITQNITTTVIGGGATANGGNSSSGSRSDAGAAASHSTIHANGHH